jgi:hypothetical protein
MRTHTAYLAHELKDKEFAREFRREKAQLRIAYDIQTTRQRLGLTQKDLAGIADVLGMDVGLVARRPAHAAAKTGKKVRV